MAIEKRIVIDHVFIKFASGEPHQTTPSGEKLPVGSLCGIHQANVEYLIDTDTGEVVGRTNNPINDMAQAVAAADLQDLLGQQFSAISEQVTRLLAAEKTLTDERDALKHRVDVMTDQLSKSAAAVNEAAETIKKMVAATKAQDEELRLALVRADMAERKLARPANRVTTQEVPGGG